MPSNIKVIQSHKFTGGMDSDIAPESMGADQYRYMLNCNVLSSSDGDVSVVANIYGNKEISVPLPPSGITKGAIGIAPDEESGYLYFAVWNSEGYHTWYRYSIVSDVVDIVLQSRTDTGDIDIFGWKEDVFILSANVISNSLLSWSMEGQPPRKFDIRKAMDKSDSGYGAIIEESWTRAYKRTAVNAPFASYFTDTTKKFNRVYRYQFQFAQRYNYDNFEKSEVSDWSNVPNPDEEFFTGTRGVPERNNGIKVTVETGSDIVVSIEILMRKTNPEGGSDPWVVVANLDKNFYGISSDSSYTYNFYNDGAYVSIDPKYPVRNNSSIPRDPLTQDFTKNSLMYANFTEGRDQIDLDVSFSVSYEDIFLPDSEENKLNNPSLNFNQTGRGREPTGNNYWKWVSGIFVVGNDVKAGNVFTVTALSTKGDASNINPSDPWSKSMVFTVTANVTDTAETIANKLAEQMRQSTKFGPSIPPGGFVGQVTIDGSGNASFDVRITNNAGWSYWQIPQNIYVNPVNTVTLKDTGQSVRNIKNGSSHKFGLVYRDDDGRKEAVQSNESMIVPIMTMNELGGIKKPVITFDIKHRPPLWAKEYSIVITEDLVYGSYLYMLIQDVVEVNTGSDSYYDLVVGSVFTYQQLHPNTIIKYEFKQGDRVRLAYKYNPAPAPDAPDFDVAAQSKDFEVIEYKEVNEEIVRSEIKVDGTATAQTTAATSNNIGNYIRINTHERLITGATDGVSYTMNDDYPADGGDATYPSFVIINRRGVLRMKHDPAFPINDLDIVEVYAPAIGSSSVNDEQFFEFGQRFDILNWGTDTAYHAGNVRNQDALQGALVSVSTGTSYVRNREMPTSNNPFNPQVLIAIIEDRNYSDFYVSDLSDYGKANVLDQGFGEVYFGSRIRWSSNYIEGTRINGLNDFDNDARVDYNDKYGTIKLILYSEDRLYVFKHSKCSWATVYARRITETSDADLIAASPRILPDMLTYLLWDGGCGNNPESIVRNGNNIYLISPDSGVWIRIGGDGAEPISKTWNLDRDTRLLIESAKRAKAKIISWFDRKNDNAEINFASHRRVVYDSLFSESGWDVLRDPVTGGTYSIDIVSAPLHGSVVVSGTDITYNPDTGYSGPDSYTYAILSDGVEVIRRNICITVNYIQGPLVWRPINPFCIQDGGGLPCGTSVNFSGGSSFPTEEEINIGPETGVVDLIYDAMSVPDKFTLEYEGVIVLDTGYRGDSSQQTFLNQALADRGLPPENIQGPGQGTASFSKTGTSTTAILRVWAPMSGTAWNVTVTCPS